ncbi:hypothetical protein D3C84_369530 [compost metagenome]
MLQQWHCNAVTASRGTGISPISPPRRQRQALSVARPGTRESQLHRGSIVHPIEGRADRKLSLQNAGFQEIGQL